MTDEQEQEEATTLRLDPDDALEAVLDLLAAASGEGDQPITLTRGEVTIAVGGPREAANMAREMLGQVSGSVDRDAYNEVLGAYNAFRKRRRAKRVELLLTGVHPKDLPL